MITYPISSKISQQYYRLFFHLSEAATGDVLLEKVFLEISQNLHENACGRVSFSIKMQAEATASDLSCVFSWRFLVYFISTGKWNIEKEIPWWRIVYKKTDKWYIEWQRVTLSDSEWYNEWQRMTTSGNDWQLVVQPITTSDNEWFRLIFLFSNKRGGLPLNILRRTL